MESETKIRISIQNGELEISGSETFVREQIESFKELIVEALQRTKKVNVGKSSTDTPVGAALPANAEDFYPHVYSIEEDTVSIIASIPGQSIPEKTVNTALLYLYAKATVLNQDDVPADEIKQICDNHGFYDSKKFTSHLKAAKSYFVLKGARKNYTAKITVPGKQRALELLRQFEVGDASA